MSYGQTSYWIVDKNNVNSKHCREIKDAALWIKEGEIVAFPTETVYGLGGNALLDEAIEKIFSAKGRPNDNPLIVHIGKVEQLSTLVENVPLLAKKMVAAFWPGPLTIIFKDRGIVSRKVTAGLKTVAIRMPAHPVALALLQASDVPIAAPSANLSGKPSPTTAAHVYDDLRGKIKGIIDGGSTGVGLESTVVDCTSSIPMILRPGGITKEQLEAVVGPVVVDPALQEKNVVPKSPGVKYRHYSPDGKLFLVAEFPTTLQQLVNERRKLGGKVGVLTTEENKHRYDADVVLACGFRENLATVANALYNTLRQFNEHNVDYIYAETFPTIGVGAAIMNRLEKAAVD